MGFQKSPSSFTRSQSEEHVESFGPSLLQKHNVNHVMCITFKFHPLIQEKTKKEKRKERLRIPIKILYYIISNSRYPFKKFRDICRFLTIPSYHTTNLSINFLYK